MIPFRQSLLFLVSNRFNVFIQSLFFLFSHRCNVDFGVEPGDEIPLFEQLFRRYGSQLSDFVVFLHVLTSLPGFTAPF